ncbi:MAG: putative toxin-antitoxin system toxin component, PIN family [Pseudanabaena sp.]|jgi:putative PIN family toxin of toxin-antitoxin system|nr:putative toxin-antitoxin system toxin component, PIN family [Pseudanabaena sp. M090S1SP2A07QC]MCA6530623.1 putative toxin-antitoxin system toxin component, PIN family [Pseudanabaena sp. M125S2SP2A07QC]MCA6533548.1 putative toxin-antitoxin system toxin component, PIN family [Pseudanabaena sp. M176S2SP2A07QC]MCA6539798.1 putative toxin-antitoxin system toxin component, PIN family [Pseudanabaena sp. M037S2SP2A07QC]MCA6544171.1 putative toxin-antitoxin system toxin component, PIN family [Pseudan
MKVVIDTNILVSAAIRDGIPEIVIQFIVDHPEFEWIASQEIMTEYTEVLQRRKLKLSAEVQQEWIDLLQTVTKLIEVNIEVDFPRDRKDAKFLACAIAANIDFLITGDQDFEDVQILENTTILSVRDFKKLFCD